MIRIIIADDHAIVRGGLKQIIATTTDIVVAGEASNGGEVITMLRQGECDLLLQDMSMPGVSGVELIKRVRVEKPSMPMLVLSMHNEGQIVARALKAGASGYVTKGCEPEMLLCAIRKVAAGGRFIDPSLVDMLVFEGSDADRLPQDMLSDREFQILQMIADGYQVGEIAELLHLSAKTVSTHKVRLMRKLHINNDVNLVRYAIKQGLVLD